MTAPACAEEDPELFFPVTTGATEVRAIARAKAVCGRCEVRAACLDFALTAAEPAGIWGGLTTAERERLLQGRGIDRMRPRHPHPLAAAQA